MKQVIKYESDNGTLFSTKEEAEYEDKIDQFDSWLSDAGCHRISYYSREIAELILTHYDLTPKVKKD